MKKMYTTALLAMFLAVSGCQQSTEGNVELFDRDNLIAWCIVPFDAADRSPEERADMLDELGFSHFAYDYRDRHIPEFREEIGVLQNHGIALSAVWLWLEPAEDTLFSKASREILDILAETGTSTDLWVSFPAHFFEGMTEAEKLEKGVDAIKTVLLWAEEHGCTLSLYNHGDWFGEPENQIRIIEAIGSDKVRIVYNFHHGHEHVDRFETLFGKMLPYLSAVNINGMRVEGPKIITLGEGDRELEMLKIISRSGYKGPVGIIGHTEGEDIRVTLERNLTGLEQLSPLVVGR
jgi:hypothetical protein